MEWPRGVARIGWALTVVLLLGSVASAGPKEDGSAAMSEWGRALSEDDPDKVLPLYAEEAVLWGTLSPMVRADRAALRDYFVTAFRVLPGLKVTFGDQLIRVYGNPAINTGYYTFSYSKDGEVKILPARYSFTYINNGERWLISRSPFLGNAISSEIGSLIGSTTPWSGASIEWLVDLKERRGCWRELAA